MRTIMRRVVISMCTSSGFSALKYNYKQRLKRLFVPRLFFVSRRRPSRSFWLARLPDTIIVHYDASRHNLSYRIPIPA